MKFKLTSTEALNVNSIINQMSLFKTVILEDQYNGRLTYYVPVFKNGRIFIANWNNASMPHDDSVSVKSPKAMKEFEYMLINQLPITKLSDYDQSIITLISDAMGHKLKKIENKCISMRAYIKPFPA